MPSEHELGHHPLLPKLKQGSDNKIANFMNHGVWDCREFSELDKLSDSLKVEPVATQISSIPDMWARPLLFEMALYDASHILHARTVDEWRGLLSLLAFKELKGFDLQIRAVEVPPDQRNNGNYPPFLSTLEKLAPNGNTLSPDTLWFDTEKKFYPFIIIYNNQPIGMLSPTTLVCTAEDCLCRLDGISWSEGRFLTDPSGKVSEDGNKKKSELNPDEKRILAQWLEELKRKMSDLHEFREHNSRLNTIISLLADFISDLGGAGEGRASLSESGFGVLKGIFQFLEKPLKHSADGTPASHLMLMPSPGRAPSKTLFIVDRSIADQWKMPESSVVVYQGATLADIPWNGFGRERKRIRGIHLEENEELCLIDDIFTPKLCVINIDKAFPGALSMAGSDVLKLQNNGVTPVLPFTEKILTHVNNDEFQKNIIFEQSSGESIHVRLKLRLAGPDGTGRFIELRKEYKKDEIERLMGTPVLEIWPNFIKRYWMKYFTYFSTVGRESTFFAKPFVLNEELSTKVISGDSRRIESQITRSASFPSAILCYALRPNAHLNRMDEHYSGVILLKMPAMVPESSDIWRIGVDFGTTSTSVYIAQGDQKGEPLVFRKELIAGVTLSGSDRAKLFDEFIPAERKEIPFLSFYQEFQNHREEKIIEIFSGGHIYFLDKSQPLRELPNNVSTNLKWSDDEYDRIKTTAFLEQLCCHALVYAASKGSVQVSWRYSYPTAFSEIITSGLPQQWQLITERCHASTGIQRLCPPPCREEQIEQECKRGVECQISNHAALKISESHAAAIYFADILNASTKYGTICLDIGGGSTDVAIWQEDRLLYQISLRFAGREIFLNTLRFNPGFLERFGTNVTLLHAFKDRPFNFYAQADSIIEREGDKWFQQLPNKLGQPETLKLVQIIAIGLSGLFFFIGQVLRFLIERKEYESEIPDIYIGGNGSKLFHWLTAGKYNPDHPINDLFKQMLCMESGLKENDPKQMKIILSPDPKREAAYGLVGKKELYISSNAVSVSEVISGESIIIEGELLDRNCIVTASTFKKSMEIPAELTGMKAFVEIFNQYIAKTSSKIQPIDNEIILNDLRKRLGGEINDIGKKNQKDISVEPIFFLALKILLKICAEEWKTYNKK